MELEAAAQAEAQRTADLAAQALRRDLDRAGARAAQEGEVLERLRGEAELVQATGAALRGKQQILQVRGPPARARDGLIRLSLARLGDSTVSCA